MYRKLQEECGVFAIYSCMKSDVASKAYTALYALQHRGQESCGIAVNDDGVIVHHCDLGLVPDVFGREELEKLGTGNMAVGHVRYAPTGVPTRENAQPLVVHHIKGPMVLAHNGKLTNSVELREELELEGSIFRSYTDCEVMSYVITKQRLSAGSIEDALNNAMSKLKGAYSLVIMSPTKLIAARDPHGFRPLCMGKLGDDIIFASETCALDGLGATFIRELDPGEIVVISPQGIRSIRDHCGSKGTLCVFEYVYFARPDSVISGQSVHLARLRAGQILAQEHPVDADIVVGVPDSGLDAALGYSRESGIPYGVGFIKNRYVGRTFIQPEQGLREKAVRIKLGALRAAVEGKRVILVDDSIVRGTTGVYIIRLLREAGATEVHLRISSPPFLNPCYFGTDIDGRDKLIACRMNIEQLTHHFEADSIGYLSIKGVQEIAKNATCGFCDGCFTGNYPAETPTRFRDNKFCTKLSSVSKENTR